MLLVFQAVLNAGSGNQHTTCFLSGAVTPYNLEALYTYVLERATDQHASSCFRDLKVSVTGTHKESGLPEICQRLRQLEAQGVKVIIV